MNDRNSKVIRILLKIFDWLVLPLCFGFGFLASSLILSGQSSDYVLEAVVNSSVGILYSLVVFCSIVVFLSCVYLDSRIKKLLDKLEVYDEK